MEVKYSWILAPLLLATSAHVSANDSTNQINYGYAYADVSAGSLNENLGVNNNVTALAVGGNYLWTENILFTLDYTARFIHPEDFTTELYTLLPGVAYRYPVLAKLDLVAKAKIGYLWAKQSQDSTNAKLFSDSDLVLGAGVELKYALTDDWELAAGAEFNYTDFLEEEIYQLRADYRISPRITLGGFYTHRSGDFETVKIAGSATTNEGGISLRFLF
ncbi:outer membrane beta-barrel protein [Vibrio brasiliensis]